MRLRFACGALLLACAGLDVACGTGGSASSRDAGINTSFKDSTSDSPSDGPSQEHAMKIVTTNGTALEGAPGDALNLEVVFILADGGILAVPSNQISWIAPETVVAQDPNDAGRDSVLPAAGVQPAAFFVSNIYSGQYGPGALFVVAPGSVSDGGVTVTASVSGAGLVSAWIRVSPAIDGGDPAHGQDLFQNVALAENLTCADCHGTTAAGSPPLDGGIYEVPILDGGTYTYPAPGLNNSSSNVRANLAADPTWSAGLLGLAVQADIDNKGVALRGPMPDFFQTSTNDGGVPINAQDFADIYAWLKTQTH